jgi:hypothetical protein
MTDYRLLPHPDFPNAAVTAVTVSAEREEGSISLTYHVEGNLDQVLWPEVVVEGGSRRADGLWKHTCFEAFVQPFGVPAYIELNFSPSGRWAAYSFDRPREGMRDFVGLSFDGSEDEFLASMMTRGSSVGPKIWSFSTFSVFDEASDWRLGINAVIEAKDGTKSYWALAHAPGPPDFHNPDCFIATLPAPERP